MVDTVVLSFPTFLMTRELKRDFHGFVSGLVWGVGGVFVLLTTFARIYPWASGALCVTYAGTFAWLSGNLLYAIFMAARLTKPVYGTPEIEVWDYRVVPRPAVYLGLLLGVAFAFPWFATARSSATELAGDSSDDVGWCQTGKDWHIVLVILHFLFAGLISAKIGVHERRVEPQAHNNDDNNSTRVNGGYAAVDDHDHALEMHIARGGGGDDVESIGDLYDEREQEQADHKTLR